MRGKPLQLPPLLNQDTESEWRSRLSDPDSIVVLDLFAGAGGMSYGFEHNGFVIAGGLDHDVHACETFAANHLAPARQVDLSKPDEATEPHRILESLGVPRIHVIIGGPPCQGFSQVGLAKVRSLTPEIRDRIYAKNQLYREFVRFVGALQPLMFVMENVPHLSNFGDGLVARQIREDFANVGYQVYEPMLLDATAYGVPQMRRRLFFVGSRIGWVFRKPMPTHGVTTRIRTLADAIAELPKVTAPFWDEEMKYVPRERPDLRERDPEIWSHEYARLMRSRMPTNQELVLFDHIVRAVREDDAEIFRSMRPGGTYDQVDEAYRRYELKRASDGDAHFADRYYRLPWDRPSVTVTAHIAKDGYRYIYPDNEQIRTLSIREAARIQSFPDHFRFAGYRTNRFVQIGNAVPPLLAAAIAREVDRAIRGYRRGQVEEEWQPPLPLFGSGPNPVHDDPPKSLEHVSADISSAPGLGRVLAGVRGSSFD